MSTLYWKACGYIMNQTHIQTKELPRQIAMMEEDAQRIREVMDSVGTSYIKDYLEATISTIERKVIKLRNLKNCTCDWEYGEADPDCIACLNQWRNDRYGYDIHDVNCACNDCNGFNRGW